MKERLTQVLLTIAVLLLGVHLGRWWVRPAAAGAPDRIPDVIRAHEIQLVGRDGKAVAQLHLGDDGSGNLRLRSAEGEVRVKLGAMSSGSALVLLDRATEPGVWLLADSGDARITLAEQGKDRRVLEP
jgi:hypothetical protein